MTETNPYSSEQEELDRAVDRVLESPSRKKLVLAGPGAGKTWLFKKVLASAVGDIDRRIVLTFINNLKDDLESDLGELSQVHTLHGFCNRVLHQDAHARGSLSEGFRCHPGLISLIKQDWTLLRGSEAPKFIAEMRELSEDNSLDFYLQRGNYYDSVDFDDSVYRVLLAHREAQVLSNSFDLVLVDEYQDFNRLEAEIIDALGETSAVLVAGDDDQALYSQLRSASWDHIRKLAVGEDYEVFNLPFCMRCPEVVVSSVTDVLSHAQASGRLAGRIDKPFRHSRIVKGEDSAKYPYIECVKTSVQSKRVNYIGRYLAECIASIPQEEINQAIEGGYPAALVIVARPYRDQVIEHFVSAGLPIDTKDGKPEVNTRTDGLQILKEERVSNLGWRIVLSVDQPDFLRRVIEQSHSDGTGLIDLVDADYRDAVMADVEVYNAPDEDDLAEANAEAQIAGIPPVKITSFEGSKGLSAQHVFIVGLHKGELPRDEGAIKDLEICKLLVGLTRTRKKCTLIHTGRFGTDWKSPSCFISWISPERLVNTTVDKTYWS